MYYIIDVYYIEELAEHYFEITGDGEL